MYIEPNSIVKILHGVPLDNKYEHTLCWDHYGNNAKTVQRNYFDNADRIKYTLTKQTYQRYDRGYIKVAIPVDNLYDCNYMMFQNTSYGNKWFYAFITNVSYVNGNNQTGTTLIEYEIDRMQTWYFDYKLMQCFVEREHSATDEVGDNIVDEGLNTGDYIYTNAWSYSFSDFYYLINYVPNGNEFVYASTTYPDYIGRVAISSRTFLKPYTEQNITQNPAYISCGLYIAIPCNGDSRGTATKLINQLLEQLSLANCSIISICAVPQSNIITQKLHESYFLYEYNFDLTNPTIIPESFECEPIEITINYPTEFRDKQGNVYRPKNNKLFYSPYCAVELRSPSSTQYIDYKFSNEFTNKRLKLLFEEQFLPEYRASLIPLNYNGLLKNYNNSCSLALQTNFSYSVDSYNLWLSQNLLSTALKTTTSAVKSMISLGIGASVVKNANISSGKYTSSQYNKSLSNMLGKLNPRITEKNASMYYGTTNAISQAESSLLENVLNTCSTIEQARNLKDSYEQGSDSNISFLNRDNYIGVFYMTLFPKIAEIIDSYFTRFGYATKITKVPNRNVRTHFCYTKTIGCEINGELPQSEREVICNVYDHGITFWKYAADIGNYDVDNPPV